MRVGHDIWHKYAVLFDGLAVSPAVLVPWIQKTVEKMSGQVDAGSPSAQLSLFMKDGNGMFMGFYKYTNKNTSNNS